MADSNIQAKPSSKADVPSDSRLAPAAASHEEKLEPSPVQQVEYRLHSPRLPLAVYREVAAHLRQINGVTTGLMPQTSSTFDYLQSQVGGVWIRYRADAADVCQPQIEAILTYYGNRYGNWETLGKQQTRVTP